jgi:hypothetical protein
MDNEKFVSVRFIMEFSGFHSDVELHDEDGECLGTTGGFGHVRNLLLSQASGMRPAGPGTQAEDPTALRNLADRITDRLRGASCRAEIRTWPSKDSCWAGAEPSDVDTFIMTRDIAKSIIESFEGRGIDTEELVEQVLSQLDGSDVVPENASGSEDEPTDAESMAPKLKWYPTRVEDVFTDPNPDYIYLYCAKLGARHYHIASAPGDEIRLYFLCTNEWCKGKHEDRRVVYTPQRWATMCSYGYGRVFCPNCGDSIASTNRNGWEALVENARKNGVLIHAEKDGDDSE